MDPVAELERIDRFFEGNEKGDIPIEVLRQRGTAIPPEETLDDDELHAKLWEVIEEMWTIGMVLDFTDHLSDRELYRYLVDEVLPEERILSEDGTGFWHISPIGVCSEEDNKIYLRYYADDGIREDWQKHFREAIPPKERPPFDRDQFLPGK